MDINKRRNIALICILIHFIILLLLFIPIYPKEGIDINQTSYYSVISAFSTFLYKNTLCIVLFVFTILVFISSFNMSIINIVTLKKNTDYVSYFMLSFTVLITIALFIVIGINI